MTGGNIENCRATNDGSGVIVETDIYAIKYGSLTMNGGTIDNHFDGEMQKSVNL